jgi:hypothetical protein
MSENKETKVVEQTLSQAMLPALIVWLKTVFYFVVLPYKIWKSTTLRLATLSGTSLIEDGEEFPMYTFTKISYDTTIFMLGIFVVIVAIIGIFAQPIAGVFAGLLPYFIIPVISLLKEIITMSLGVIKRLEAIDHNTRK